MVVMISSFKTCALAFDPVTKDTGKIQKFQVLKNLMIVRRLVKVREKEERRKDEEEIKAFCAYCWQK